MQVAEKKVPWWRKALDFALGGIRSGFGLFPRAAKPASLEKDSFLHRSEETLEEEPVLTDPSANPEAVAAVPATGAEQTPAPTPVPAPDSGPAIGPADPMAPLVPEISIVGDAPELVAVAAEVPEIVPETVPAPEPQAAAGADSAEAAPSLAIASHTEPTVEPEAKPEPEAEFEPEPKSEADLEPEPESQLEAETEAGPDPEPESIPETAAVAEPPVPEEPLADADSAPLSAPANDWIEPTAAQPAEPAEPEDLADLAAFAPVHTVETAPEQEPAESLVAEAAIPAESVATAEPIAVAEPIQAASALPEPPAAPAIEPVPVQQATPSPTPASEPVPEPAPEPAPGQSSAEKPAEKAPITLKSRDNEADLSPFSVVVGQVYDGPLDLLLDLIRKQDIDIYDIPISKITAQFLAYVNQLKATDVDVAGEFIYTASLLIHIKSKMLLPRAVSGPEDAAEDPRRELVERLLEHERFKNAAQMLQQKQMLEAATWTNPGLREFKDDESAEPEIAADTVDLVRIFRDILERARKRPVFNLDEDAVTVGQMIQFLARRLTMEDKPVALRRLLSHTRSERALVAMFLALLELVRLQAVLLRQDRAFSEIFIKKHTGFDAVMNQGLANASDDWR
jgi:segregation and condensation protein A